MAPRLLDALGHPHHGQATGLQQADQAAPVEGMVVHHDDAQLVHTTVIRVVGGVGNPTHPAVTPRRCRAAAAR